MSERVVSTLDEKVRSELDDWLAGFSLSPFLSSYHYRQCLRRVLLTIAAHGNAVILGRGSNFLLPSEKRTLGLYLVAPLETRVKKIMQELNLSQESALKHIIRTEREQRLWVKKCCGADINDAANYHMVINTMLVTAKTLIQIVKEILRE